MFITHPPRQTRHKRFVSARTAYPCRHTPQSHGRATGERERHTGDCGLVAPPAKVLSAEAACVHSAEVLSVYRVTFFGAKWRV